jgi:ornithine cyclodeaminase/alanine dehydrogenase-like protein (mu-crystallin family)
MQLLSERVVAKILPVELAIAAAVEAFSVHSSGGAIIPLRNEIHRTDPDGTALIMPGLIGNHTLGVKLVSSVAAPDGKRTTAFLLVWDAATLQPRGLIAGDALNDHRTAAGLAAATKVLARPDSEVHTLYGAGKLAFASALHISAVRPIRRLLLCSRTQPRVLALAERIRRDERFAGVEVVTDATPTEAAAAADIVTAVTTSDIPVFDGRALRDGVHINLGGASRRHQREMDDAAAARADFWLDSEESCRARAGDLIHPLESGAMTAAQVKGEIGAVFLGRIAGRTTPEQITMFKSMGIATQDLVLAARLLDLALAQGEGSNFDHING